MKKFISMMLAAAVLMCCMATVAFAAEPGDTVTITFNASGNPGFATFGAKINYDSSALELVEIQVGGLCAGGMFSAPVSTGIVGYVGMSDVTGDGTLFTATFKIKADAAPGTYTVSAGLDTATTYNNAGEQVTFGITGGTVTVDAPVCEHEWDEGVITTAATCEAEGVKTFTCTKCGETKTEVIPATGHAWGEWTVTQEPTCDEPGVETRICANDETHVETREIPAKGHTLEGYEYDEEGHWQVCDCGHKTDKEAHFFENNGYCKCGYKKPAEPTQPDPGLDDEPQTGDVTPMILFSMFCVAAVAGTAVVASKRKNAR